MNAREHFQESTCTHGLVVSGFIVTRKMTKSWELRCIGRVVFTRSSCLAISREQRCFCFHGTQRLFKRRRRFIIKKDKTYMIYKDKKLYQVGNVILTNRISHSPFRTNKDLSLGNSKIIFTHFEKP